VEVGAGQGLLVDDELVRVVSGSVHSWRIDEDRWAGALRSVRELGSSMIDTYVPWSVHERESGDFVFIGKLDVERATVPDQMEGVTFGGPIGEPVAVATRVRAATGHERAVVIDEGRLDELVREATGHARDGRTLQEYRPDVETGYRACPGIATDSAPPRSPPAAIRSFVRSRGDELRAVLLTERLAVEVVLVDGLVTKVSCPALDRSDIETADAHLGSTWSELATVIGSTDPFVASADFLDEAADQQGLGGLADVLRGG